MHWDTSGNLGVSKYTVKKGVKKEGYPHAVVRNEQITKGFL